MVLAGWSLDVGCDDSTFEMLDSKPSDGPTDFSIFGLFLLYMTSTTTYQHPQDSQRTGSWTVYFISSWLTRLLHELNEEQQSDRVKFIISSHCKLTTLDLIATIGVVKVSRLGIARTVDATDRLV